MGTTAQQQLVGEALKQIWGYSKFRPHQKASIQAIMEGRDSLTVLPTGGGKSLCYQLPAAISQGTAIVVSPLISLMADQVNALNLLGVPAACLNSSQDADEIRRTKARMFAGEFRLLYVSPERLLLEHFLEDLRQVPLTFFAIDEAHCISQWGHDFRPEYKQLSQLRARFPHVGIHAFTATAPPELQSEIVGELQLRSPEVLVGSYFRPNLKYRVLRRNKLNQQLLGILKEFDKNDCGIIYCLTRKETERTADFLSDKGYKALPYHAGLSSEIRHQHQDLFSQEKVPIIVATVAFGMGIDQSNVRFVIHTGMPRTVSHYQQESGRAGRDGLFSQCVLIHGAKDILFWKRIIEEEVSLADIRMNQLRDMISYAGQVKCRHRILVEHFGQQFKKANCGNCDVCLGEIEGIEDARRYSRMIISAVLKVRMTFGGAYVAQVLTGSKEKKILRNGHDRLTVYGLLKDYSQYQVHDWINQLESQGYLVRSGGDYPVIGVSKTGYWLLRPDKYEKDETDVPVVLIETRTHESSKAAKKKSASEPYDRDLFELLRQERTVIASRLGVPAFIVFGDKSLQDMARKKPQTEDQFLEVFGVGEAKLMKFGLPMIKVIRTYLDGDSAF